MSNLLSDETIKNANLILENRFYNFVFSSLVNKNL